LYKTYALADSLSVFGFNLHVLVVDSFDTIGKPVNVIFYPIQTLIETELGSKMFAKYAYNSDKLRWGFKPIFLLHLLIEHDKVVYVDNDICFYSDPHIIDSLLTKYSILLTPHFYPSSPRSEQNWLEANFRVGLYNAGFVATQSKAKEALEWWAACCLYNLKKSFNRGLFDDQKYLDLLPIQFNGVHIIKEFGYNLAGWNAANYQVTRTSRNEVFVGPAQKLVCIHFANISLKMFSNEGHHLHPEYLQYISRLKKYNPGFTLKSNKLRWYDITAYFNYVKWNLLRLFER
jgi:hypothetical protein